MDPAQFVSPRPVQRRPPKIIIPSQHEELHVDQHATFSPISPYAPNKAHLQYVPSGYRAPYDSSSGESSPTSISPPKNRFQIDQQFNARYNIDNGHVQTLSLKTHRHDPPKQLLNLAASQPPYSPTESAYSSCSRSSSNYNDDVVLTKQVLSLRPQVVSEVSAQSGEVCVFCYQFAVHHANSRHQSPLPRVADRGCWRGHVMKEGERIVCPRLLRRVCSLCGATGQSAHMNNYCPVTKKYTSSY